MNRPVHGDSTRGVGREHDGLARVAPADVTRRNRAFGRADVLADREMEIVAIHTCARVAGCVPELRVSGIEIEVRLAAQASHQRFEREMTADVQQQVRAFGDIQDLAIRDAARHGTAVVNER